MSVLRIGICGAGGVARQVHIPGFQRIDGVEVAAICDPDEAAACGTGIERRFVCYQTMIEEAGIDAVVAATPNHTHSAIVHAAARAGKHVLCEKPLARDLEEARGMLNAVNAAGVVHMTAFTYQFTPAFRYLVSILGEFGAIRTIRASYLMALSPHLLGWRSNREQAGSGVLADIGSHLAHLVRLIAGEFIELTAAKRSFREGSDMDDWVSMLAHLGSGASATLEISRICAGRGAGIGEEMTIEVYGSRQSAVFALQDPLGLRVADGSDVNAKFQRVAVPADLVPPGEGDARWLYRYDQAQQFMDCIRGGESRTPTLEDGVRCQAVLDAALESCETGRWVHVQAC
jgi:predicted dehydrogenase